MSNVQDEDRARLLASYRARRTRRSQDALFTSNSTDLARALGRRARGALGDYMRDEDFDTSYEGLINLAASIGEVKPRSTPSTVIEKLEVGLYKEWKTSESDQRCPICLDDYQLNDILMKLDDCTHWLHQECLQQWLKGASTCPVCRKTVTGRPGHHGSNEAGPSRRRGGPSDDGRGSPSGFRPVGGSDQLGAGEWIEPPWRWIGGEQ